MVCGPKYALVNLATGVVCAALLYGSLALITDAAGIDLKFWVGDVVLTIFWAVIFIASEITLRAKWAAKDRQDQAELQLTAASTAPSPGAAGAAPGAGHEAPAAGTPPSAAPKATFAGTMLELVPILAAISVMLLYPILVVPAFISGTTTTRMLLCLLLHPVLLEAGEAIGRSTKGGITYDELERGEITIEQAEKRIVQTSLTSFPFKQLMAIYRRLMLLNIGDADATIAAVVAASIEEALERGFLVEVDGAIRRWRGLTELQGGELRLQQLVWMCDTNQSAVAEVNAILLSSFAQLLLEPHAQFMALGYVVADGRSDAVVVFLQLLIELMLEVGVDMVAMWAETEHGIPVTYYFRLVRSSKYFIYHAAVGVTTTAFALYSFIRHPNFAQVWHALSSPSRRERTELPLLRPLSACFWVAKRD